MFEQNSVLIEPNLLKLKTTNLHARKKLGLVSLQMATFIACFTLVILSIPSNVIALETSFNFTGNMQTFMIPSGVNEIQIQVWGAEGATADDRLSDSIGGLGGYASGLLSVTPGQVLNIFVGGQGGTDGTGGFNGGGTGGNSSAGEGCLGGPSGGGGGATDIRIGGMALNNRVIVAGGGGGGGRDYCNGSCQPCGCGGGGGGAGGLNGVNGVAAYDCGYGYSGNGVNFGGGATQIAGGIGGPQDGGSTYVGINGSLGQGGNGANAEVDVAGGGGGGGYYGGGGGGGAAYGSGVGGGGGGGGSSYTGGVTDSTTQTGIRNGDGQVVITYGEAAAIPTMTEWGMIIMSLLLAGTAVWMIRRKTA